MDCGAFKGDSIADFYVAVHGKYDKIYAFEPDSYNMKQLKDYCKNINLEIITID